MTQLEQAYESNRLLKGARETIRGLFREKYSEEVAPYRRLIRQGVANTKWSPITVLLSMRKNAAADGHPIEDTTLVLFLAAVADEIEGVPVHADQEAA